MPQLIAKIIKPLDDFWSGLERPKRVKLIVLLCILLALVTAFTIMLNRKEYVTLYSGLDPADAGEILEKLREMKIDAKPVGNDTIKVLKQQEPGVRMQLSAQGYPRSGFNYDLFMNGISFGTTDYEKRKYLQFQLQDRLQSAIKTLNGVTNAIVTISIPEEDSFVFRDEKLPATASIILELEKGYRITPSQVKGIEELVSKSIQGLNPEDISIIDSNMVLLNPQGNSESELAGTQIELENQVRDRFQRQVSSLLEPVFGYGNVLASVNVRLNFDKQVVESVRYQPVVDDEGIAVSMVELKEEVKGSGRTGGVPGQDSNGAVPQYQAAADEDSDYQKVSRTVNYEIDQIREQIESAQGQIKDLSVSVVINRPEMAADVKESVRGIVAAAVGIDAEQVVVENMSFESSNGLKEQIDEAMKIKGFESLIVMLRDLLIYGVIALFALIAFVLVYRLIREHMHSRRVADAVSLMESVAAEEPVIPALEIDEHRQSNAQRDIEQLVMNRPQEAAQLLRTWLSEG